ncbi:unnamed protein product [Prorocentrum cordatum]|uniref:MOSC domain-containing protein n=1 Tax=Prorocentrum cordatum TaxID=2364126 RepID=A0ABN9R5D0_9DINO|nr:unnamed protein product [Polarella glacialis]
MARPPATRVLHLAVEPRLALIRPELDDHLSPAARLELRAPGMQDLRVPSPSAEADRIEVGLWDTPGVALDCGQQAAEWLGHLLGRGGLRLAHLSVGPGGAGARPREPCREPHWNGGAEANSVYYPGSRVGFADSTLGTLLSASSIDDLNRRAPKGAKLLAPQNFRMNVIVSGTRPNEEEMWKGFCIGTVSGFVTSKLCSRCTATNVDPETGTKLPSVGQPLRLLSRYRGLGQVWRMDGRHRGPAFGVNFGGSAKKRRHQRRRSRHARRAPWHWRQDVLMATRARRLFLVAGRASTTHEEEEHEVRATPRAHQTSCRPSRGLFGMGRQRWCTSPPTPRGARPRGGRRAPAVLPTGQAPTRAVATEREQ